MSFTVFITNYFVFVVYVPVGPGWSNSATSSPIRQICPPVIHTGRSLPTSNPQSPRRSSSVEADVPLSRSPVAPLPSPGQNAGQANANVLVRVCASASDWQNAGNSSGQEAVLSRLLPTNSLPQSPRSLDKSTPASARAQSRSRVRWRSRPWHRVTLSHWLHRRRRRRHQVRGRRPASRVRPPCHSAQRQDMWQCRRRSCIRSRSRRTCACSLASCASSSTSAERSRAPRRPARVKA